jgi:hypothetical protein
MTTALEQSLADDIAAEKAAAESTTKEKDAGELADKVTEQLEEKTHEQLSEEAPSEGEEGAQEEGAKEEGEASKEDDEVPQNPTAQDFARMRIKAREAERAAREAERAAAKLREEMARKEGYYAAKGELPPEKVAEKPDPEPNFDENPRGWIEWHNRQHAKEVEQLKQGFRAFQMESQVKSTVNIAKGEEAEYAKAHPEYTPAKDYLTGLVTRNMRAQNPMMSEPELQALVLQEEYKAILHAKSSGVNPAIYFKMLAENAGYKPTAAKEEKKEALPEKKPDMDAIKRNKGKTHTLVGTRSNAGGMGEPTDEEIADLTLAQMAKLK